MRQEVRSVEDFSTIKDNQIILQDEASFSINGGKIVFSGKNNILYCEHNVHLENCNLLFSGNNNVIYLSSSTHTYRTNITVYNNCTCFFGEDCYFNGTINIICSEEKNVFVGSNALLSFGVWIRTADPHLVYSAETLDRINPSKSVYIGDHVWIGQNALILKGSRVYSGSIIGGGAVLAGAKVPSNTSFAGNPAKQIAEEIFWDPKVVHTWTSRETKQNQHYQGEPYLYAPSEQSIPFGRIDKTLEKSKTSSDKLEYLKSISAEADKNRFAWKKATAPMTIKHRLRLGSKNFLLKILK